MKKAAKKSASRSAAAGVVSPALVGARAGGRPAADAAHRSFLFRGCFARLAGDALTVSLPAGPHTIRFGRADAAGGVRWTAPRKVARAALVRCAAGTPTAFDRCAYPKAPAPQGGVTVRFLGAVRFCRLVLSDGPALLVQGTVESIRGLPGAGTPFDTAELLPAPVRGAKRPKSGGVDPSGPHQPFP